METIHENPTSPKQSMTTTSVIYRYIGIAYTVKEQVDENKGNQRILAQAPVEANDKVGLLERQTAQLYAALMTKQIQLQQQSEHWLIESIALKVEVEEKEAKVEKEEDNTQKSRQQQLPQRNNDGGINNEKMMQ